MEDDQETEVLPDDTGAQSEETPPSSDEHEPESTGNRTLEIKLKNVGAFCAVLLLAAALGAGAYFFGRSTGEDLDAARETGATAGKRAGAVEGAAQGYAAGFKKGRKRGFERTYGPAYRKRYAQAFEDAGLDAPAKNDIDVAKQ